MKKLLFFTLILNYTALIQSVTIYKVSNFSQNAVNLVYYSPKQSPLKLELEAGCFCEADFPISKGEYLKIAQHTHFSKANEVEEVTIYSDPDNSELLSKLALKTRDEIWRTMSKSAEIHNLERAYVVIDENGSVTIG